MWLGSVAQLNCVSVAAGIETVRALMRRYPQLDAALVVVRPRVRRDYRMRQMTGVQCDGAAAMLIARNSTKNRLGGIAIETHAKWHRGSDTVAANEADLIMMEWPYTRKAIDAVALEPYALDAYELVLPHNADLPGWSALCRAMRVPAERLYAENIHARGHACCSDFPINLRRRARRGRARPARARRDAVELRRVRGRHAPSGGPP